MNQHTKTVYAYQLQKGDAVDVGKGDVAYVMNIHREGQMVNIDWGEWIFECHANRVFRIYVSSEE